MEYRYLGSSGLKVSALSFGSWLTFGSQVDEDLALECMRAAHDGGVNFFDTAEVYGDGQAEEIMGEALKRAGWPRGSLVISTKVFWGGTGPNDRGLSRKHIIEGTRASLERLQLNYVDLLYCHRPDPHTPIEETVRAMTQMVRDGNAFYWGTSEWSAEQIMAAHAVARREHLIPPTMEQPQYNLFHRARVEKEYLRLYDEVGLGTTIWSPLASGLLTGKYAKGIPEGTRVLLPGFEWLKDTFESEEGAARIQKTEQLRPIAAEIGASLSQLAIAWCLRNPHVSSVILGASRPEQVTENLASLEFVERLTPNVLDRIEAVVASRPEPTPDYRA